MSSAISFLIDFLLGKQDPQQINQLMLVLVVIGLLIALMICILISKKNHLYINVNKKNKEHKNYQENEVA